MCLSSLRGLTDDGLSTRAVVHDAGTERFGVDNNAFGLDDTADGAATAPAGMLPCVDAVLGAGRRTSDAVETLVGSEGSEDTEAGGSEHAEDTAVGNSKELDDP